MPGRADRAVAVVIPAYQAAATIAEVVSRTSRAVPGATVYVVDDGSTDGTSEAGRGQGEGATVLVHPRNRGKGAALATGIAAALEGGADVIITLDADGQHPPEEIHRLAAPVLAGDADVALGARARTGAMPWRRRCTNWLSAALASRIAGSAVPDAQSGFRALSRRAAQAVRPGEQGYDFETAFLLAALARGLRVRFVPVSTVYDGRPSHFRPWADTWRQARVFTRYGRAIIFGAR
jgi:glycosyltransferase involved in cell wall biosynthesis